MFDEFHLSCLKMTWMPRARTRVLEGSIMQKFPPQVTPSLGPDGTGYRVFGTHSMEGIDFELQGIKIVAVFQA